MHDRARRSWLRRPGRSANPAPAPVPAPGWDDIATAPPTVHPRIALVELPVAVLDLTAIARWGFGGGPIGRAGTAVLETFALAGRLLDEPLEFNRVCAAAVSTGIFDGDLDHEWDDADPDGHYDNTWLAEQYRTDGFVLALLEGLTPYADVAAAVATLKSHGIRLVAVPFLGSARTEAVLGTDLAAMFEFTQVGPAESLSALMASIADGTGVARNEISAVTATRAMTRAAMNAGVGTVWVDRDAAPPGSVYTRGTDRPLSYRWGTQPPVPVIVDDLAAAARFFEQLRGVSP